MPWRCPACETQIHHAAYEDRPRVGVRYRCHVCRLELLLNPVSGRLEAAPLPLGDDDERERPTS